MIDADEACVLGKFSAVFCDFNIKTDLFGTTVLHIFIYKNCKSVISNLFRLRSESLLKQLKKKIELNNNKFHWILGCSFSYLSLSDAELNLERGPTNLILLRTSKTSLVLHIKILQTSNKAFNLIRLTNRKEERKTNHQFPVCVLSMNFKRSNTVLVFLSPHKKPHKFSLID